MGINGIFLTLCNARFTSPTVVSQRKWVFSRLGACPKDLADRSEE